MRVFNLYSNLYNVIEFCVSLFIDFTRCVLNSIQSQGSLQRSYSGSGGGGGCLIRGPAAPLTPDLQISISKLK